MKKPTKTYPMLDLMKLFCAILVVGIHTEPFGSVGILDKMFAVVTRIAVPFFFVTSAFFHFKKPITAQGYAQFAKRLASLYISWVVIYIVVALLRSVTIGFDQIIFLVFVQGYGHFWYILALIVSVGLCSAALRLFKNATVVFVLSVALYVWGTLCSTYSSVFPLSDPIIDMISVRNGVHYGPIFVMIGYLFAQKKTPVMRTGKALLLSLLGFGLVSLEGIVGTVLLKAESTTLWFSTPLLMYGVYSACLRVRIHVPANTAIIVRKLSVGIYCVHPIIVDALQSRGIQNFPLFVLVLAISCAISLWLISKSQDGSHAVFEKLL